MNSSVKVAMWVFFLFAGPFGCTSKNNYVEVNSVIPDRGTIRGGTVVTLQGSGFSSSVRVYFGDREAEVVSTASSAIQVVSPAGQKTGVVDISVRKGDFKFVSPGAFRYVGTPLYFVDRTDSHLMNSAPLDGRLVSAADLDGDGAVDLIQAAGDGLRIYHNRSDGTFNTLPIQTVPGFGEEPFARTAIAVPADFNGNGLPDLYLALMDYQTDRVFFNEGQMVFTDASTIDASMIPEGKSHSIHAAAGDFDGDGYPDLIIVRGAYNDAENEISVSAHVALWMNDRSGGFADESEIRLPEPDLNASGVGVGDFTGNGAADLFLALRNGACRLWLNDGAGVFRDAGPSALPPHADLDTRIPAVGDLNGNGFPDIYVVSAGQDRIWINDGLGGFVDQTVERLGSGGSEHGYSAVIADLDMDGSSDVVVANLNGRLRIYRGDPMGRLFDYSGRVAPDRPAISDALGVAVLDADNDGYPEIFVSRSRMRRPWLLWNWDPMFDDRDRDGIPDEADNCPDVYNPDQANSSVYHFYCKDREDCAQESGCVLHVRSGERAYLFCTAAPLDYDDAREFCLGRGGDLVVIRTPEENDYLKVISDEPLWIGLDDRETEGEFVWVDGTELTWSDWREGEPNNSGGNEDCAGFFGEGDDRGWNDFPCDGQRGFICADEVYHGPPGPGDACREPEESGGNDS